MKSLEKLIIPRLITKFTPFYLTRMLRSFRKRPPLAPMLGQIIPFFDTPVIPLISILIISCHQYPCFPRSHFSSGLPNQIPAWHFSSSLDTPHALSTSSPFDLITRIICGEDHKFLKSSLCILQPPVTSPLPRHVLSPCPSPNVRKE